VSDASAPAVAALYGVVTFALLAGIYLAFVHLALGWPVVPEVSRLQGMVAVAWYFLAGLFARAVGQHASRGATLGQAWRGALSDLGRDAKGLIFK
jgi:hypothetical protein